MALLRKLEQSKIKACKIDEVLYDPNLCKFTLYFVFPFSSVFCVEVWSFVRWWCTFTDKLWSSLFRYTHYRDSARRV